MPSSSSYWSRLQERLRAILEPEEYATWIAPLTVQSEDESGLVLSAPNERFVHTLEESYRETLDREAAQLFDEFFSVTVLAGESSSERGARSDSSARAERPERSAAGRAARGGL